MIFSECLAPVSVSTPRRRRMLAGSTRWWRGSPASWRRSSGPAASSPGISSVRLSRQPTQPRIRPKVRYKEVSLPLLSPLYQSVCSVRKLRGAAGAGQPASQTGCDGGPCYPRPHCQQGSTGLERGRSWSRGCCLLSSISPSSEAVSI